MQLLKLLLVKGKVNIMNNDKLAVNKRIALKMFWDAGFDTEELLLKANKIIEATPQVTNGFWLAEVISEKIELNSNSVGVSLS